MAGTLTEHEPVGDELAFAPETRVGGRYRIVAFIAAGGNGEVYEAEDLVLGTTVALKTLRLPEGSPRATERAIARLRREIATARKVTHRNVCRIHDVAEHADRVFLTMELVRGETLAQRLRRAPLSADELAAIASQLVDALAAAHDAGVVHRDFKSSNVLLDPDGRAVVCDFGLARAPEDADERLTNEAALVGTPAYMAPEQVEGRVATFASDIYALGVVLYELATRALPFPGDTALAIATARLHRTAPRASAIRRDLDATLDAAIARCLEREPARRFASVRDVLAPVPRRRWPIAAGGVAIVAIGIAIAATRSTAPDELVRERYWPAQLRPAHGKASAHYDHAHAAALAGDWQRARELLEQAVAAHPADAVTQAQLAEVLAMLGYTERARDVAERASAQAATLGDDARAYVTAQVALVTGDRAAASTELRALVARFPDEPAYALALATATDRPDEVARVLDVIPGHELRGELARARVATGEAKLALAMRAAALATLAHRRHDRSLALSLAGAAHWSLGDERAAAAAYTRALEDALAVDHGGGILVARRGLLDLDLAADRIGAATERHVENLALLRRLGDRAQLAGELDETARLLAAIGRLPAAIAANTEEQRLASELADEPTLGWADATAAFLALHQGRLSDAARLAELAHARGGRLGAKGLQGNAFHTWYEAVLELDDAAAIARALAARGPSVERLIDSYVALRTGELERAERIATTLATWRTREGREAYAVIAHALVKRGELDRAQAILDRVEPLLAGDGAQLLAKRRVTRARAELVARRGDLPRALAILDAQIAACGAAELRFCELPSAALAVELARDPVRAAALVPRLSELGFRRTAREVQRYSSATRP